MDKIKIKEVFFMPYVFAIAMLVLGLAWFFVEVEGLGVWYPILCMIASIAFVINGFNLKKRFGHLREVSEEDI